MSYLSSSAMSLPRLCCTWQRGCVCMFVWGMTGCMDQMLTSHGRHLPYVVRLPGLSISCRLRSGRICVSGKHCQAMP